MDSFVRHHLGVFLVKLRIAMLQVRFVLKNLRDVGILLALLDVAEGA